NVLATSATSSTTINDGAGNATFTITGQALAFTSANAFHGNGGNDSFTLNAGIGVSGASVLLDGGTGSDSATFNGRVVPDLVTLNLLSGLGNGNLQGLGQQVDFTSLQDVTLDGVGAGNSFSILDRTNQSFGTPPDPATGIVYRPTGAASGDVTINS